MGIWDEGFEEPKVQFPEEIIKDYIKSFDIATDGYASLNLFEIDPVKKILSRLEKTNFQHEVVLTSTVVSGYSFQVFRFGYDVTIYPVYIVFEDEIGKDVGAHTSPRGERTSKITTENDFIKIIEGVFKSKRFREVVGGLIKIAKAQVEEVK